MKCKKDKGGGKESEYHRAVGRAVYRSKADRLYCLAMTMGVGAAMDWCYCLYYCDSNNKRCYKGKLMLHIFYRKGR